MGKTYTLTRRQLITAAVTLAAIVAMLLPRAIEAATGSAVNIVDKTTSSYKAKVSSGGRLYTTMCDTDSCAAVDSGKVRISDGGGSVTVDGSIQHKPTTPFMYTNAGTGEAGQATCDVDIAIPAGMRLIVEAASLFAEMPTGQIPSDAIIYFKLNGNSHQHYVPLIEQGTASGFDNFTGQFEGVGSTDGGADLKGRVIRSATTSSFFCIFSVMGYLV